MIIYKKIPIGSVEIQTGLWLYSYDKILNNKTYHFRQLFASEGYCFYNIELDTFDEEGSLLPRTYYTWMSINNMVNLDTFYSVQVQDDYEIA